MKDKMEQENLTNELVNDYTKSKYDKGYLKEKINEILEFILPKITVIVKDREEQEPIILWNSIKENEIIPKYKNKVKFVKIDIEEDEKLIKQYNILSVPTLILLKDDKEIWRKSGSISRDELMGELDKTIR